MPVSLLNYGDFDDFCDFVYDGFADDGDAVFVYDLQVYEWEPSDLLIETL
jgi:hypothetical protein